MKIKNLKMLSLKNKAVLMRVDYNVSFVEKNGKKVIADDTRIRQSLATLEYILGQKPKRVVLMSHLGRPKKQMAIDSSQLTIETKGFDASLQPVAKHLSRLIKKDVLFVPDYHINRVRSGVKEMVDGEIVMLENVRFYKGEMINSRKFAAELAQMGDLFVNDAFGSSHRAHASVVGVAEILPSAAGLLLSKEIVMINKVTDKPEGPFVAIIGGAKATTKIPMIEKLMAKADYLLLGGGVANTFLKAFGFHIGRSLYDPHSMRLAQNLIWRATRVNTKLFLPSDLVVGSFAGEMKVGVYNKGDLPRQWMALDIGPQTQKDFAEIIAKAKTIVWNGPMGANEISLFKKGTNAVYDAIAENKKALSVVGGGDTLVSIKGHDHTKNITHVSTGGGAMLEYIEKGTLPGVEVLEG